MHNIVGKGFAGPVYQRDGLKVTLGELGSVIGSLAMFVCKFAKFGDLFTEISAILDHANSQSTDKSTENNGL